MHKSKMKRISLAVCLALLPLTAGAAGLGKMTVFSGLGEPFSAEIEVSAEKSELSSLSARIASSETYAEQGVERPAALSAIRVELASKADGRPVLKLSTPQPVNEPFLDMLLQLDWPTGRLLREYTTLLDPPGYGEREQALMPAAVTQEATAPVGAPQPVKKKTSTASSALSKTSGQAEPGPDAVAEDSYRTRRGDTLRSIAKRMQPEDVSLERMLVGLFRANRSAFAGDNMNQLMVGKVVRAPEADTLRNLTQNEALQEIRVHAENWNAYRSNLAGAVAQSAPSQDKAPSQTESGKIAAAAEDKAAPAASGPRDVVKLSKAEMADKAGGAPEGKGTATDGKLQTLEEESIAQDQAIKEVSERIAFFEQQIKDMQQLLLVQNQILADLQKKSSQAPATAEPAPGTQAPVPTAPQPAAKPPVQTEVEPGLLEDLPVNPVLLGGAGGLLLLLSGVWLYLRGKRRKGLDSFEKGILTSGGLQAEPVPATVVADTSAAKGAAVLGGFAHAAGEGLIDTSDVDPISEAEVYMAYGRDAQAEEILKDALAKEPARYELHEKLLEIYANRKDAAAYDALAGELYAAVGTNHPLWQKVAEQGRVLEPGNPMYAFAEAATTEAAAELPVAQEEPVEAAGDMQATDDNSLDFDLGMLAEQAGAEETAPVEAAAPEVEMLDFETSAEAPQLADAEMQSAGDLPAMTDAVLELPEPAASGNVQLEAAELGLELEEQPAVEVVETALELPEFAIPELSAEPAAEIQAEIEAPHMAEAEPAEEMVAEVADELEAVSEPLAETVEEISFDLPELAELEANWAASVAAEVPEQAAEAELTLPTISPELEAALTEAAPVEQEAAVVESETLLPNLATESPVEAVEEIVIEQPAAETSDLEAGGLDFNFDMGDGNEPAAPAVADAAPQPLPDLDLTAISLELDSSGQGVAEADEIALTTAESADVDTKLDLVTAYMDMGDSEGARELLEEVLREGGPKQRERAQKMLDSLG